MSEIVDCISWIVQKTCYSFYIFLKFILLRFLDLLGLVFNILACLTIIRFPPMICQFSNLTDLKEWRYIGLVQFLIFISDIPVMIAGVILVLTVYRLFPLSKELTKRNCRLDINKQSGGIYYAGWKPRKIILKHFALLVIDALFIPAGILCICSWRCVIFIRKFKESNDSWERRKICFKQLFNIFVDIPCIILYLICFCTWRMPFIINNLIEFYATKSEDWEWDSIRFISFYHFGLLLLDIPCIACFFVVMVTWRCPFFLRKLKKIHVFQFDGEMKARWLAVVQFLLIFVDIPCIILFIIVALTVWRLPFFIQDCRAAFKKKKSRQWIIRKSTVIQVGLLFVDIGCLILSLCLLVTLWRVYPLVRAIRKIFEPKKQDKDNQDETESIDDNAVQNDTANDRCYDHVISQEDESLHDGEGEPRGDSVGQGDGKVILGEKEELDGDGHLDHKGEVDQRDRSDETEQPNGGGNASENKDEVGMHDDVDVGEAAEQIGYSGLTEDRETKTAKRNIGWKIRKAICIQFASLLFDIPAFAFLILLLVTVVRVPKLLSTFLQSSDIYLEFAITIYYQTFILFIDVLFLLLFLVLMILRPIQSWIRLLEDEDHMKYRLLCHHMQWIPDIIAKRNGVYQQVSELLSVDLKMYCLPSNYRTAVGEIMDDYLNELNSVRDKMNSNELDPEYIHLLDSVMWWERKRSEKAMRRYTCEYNYLLRPDAQLHKANLDKIKREMEKYEVKVNEQYTHLNEYVPMKVPLWTVDTGLSTRTRKETQKVLINCLPRGDVFLVILALLCCLPLYRAPQLVMSLWKQWYNRANIILNTVRELGYDFLTFLRVIIVLIFIYRAPALLSDISIDVIDKKSWKAVRKTVRKYPMYMWQDFVHLIKTVLSWKTPRFLFTATLFGALMPADMFLTSSKLCVKNVMVAYFMSGILYIAFIGFPFIMSFYLGKKLLELGIGWISVPVICSFVGALLLILALMVTAYVRSSKKTILVPEPFDYFHWNWFNAHVMIMELLEFFQLLALVFTYSDIPMYGSEVLNKASKFLLSSHFSFEFQFLLSFTLFFIWFLLSSVPVIFEQILEDLPKGTCENHLGWRMAISLFANTLFITMIEGFASCFACSYAKCPSGIDYSMLPSNSTCLQASLKDDSLIACWTGQHRLIALFGLFALVWYTTTSFLVAAQYGDPGIKKQDIEFSPTYNVISNFIKSVMIVGVVVITTSKYAMLGLLIVLNALMILYTVLFKTVFHYKPTNSLSFMTWRVASYFATMIAAIAVIIAYKTDKQGNKIPLIIIGVGILLCLVIAAIVSIFLRQKGNVVDAREKFKCRLQILEKRLKTDNMLLSSWSKQRSSWVDLMRKVRESRRDDQIFNEANWERLQGKETEDNNKEEGVFAINDATPQVDETHDTVCTGDGEASHSDGQPSLDPILPEYLPPPPSYGSTAVDSIEGQAINTDARMFTRGKDQIEVSPFDQPLLSLERNGVNLILVLEKSILFEAYSYSFFSQRAIWLSSVSLSNWTGLLHCLDVLESNLDFSFNHPSPFDVSMGQKALTSDVLERDPGDDDEPPSFTPESRDPEVIEAVSRGQRDQALSDVASLSEHGEHWKELISKFLPDLPVIKRWNYDEFTGHFEIILRRPVTATVTKVGPNGVKLAKGANISLGKITKGKIQSDNIRFTTGFQPKGSKGPISITVTDIAFKWKKKQWYLESQGKTVKYDVAFDSMQELQWR